MNESTFRENLRSLRKKSGLTQIEAAKRIGVSDKTLSKWETGENDPGLSDIIKLAGCFGVEPSELFAQSPTDKASGIDEELGKLAPPEAIKRAFGIQFAAIRALAKRALHDEDFESPKLTPPENLVNPARDKSITAYACPGAYLMQYNGSDTNVGLSLLPAENPGWLRDERERLADYLSLFGEADFLTLFTATLSLSEGERFTAAYMAAKTGISESRVNELLTRAESNGIVSSSETHIGDRTLRLFRLSADQLPLGMLTLVHLALPGAEKNGCWYVNSHAGQLLIEGDVK